MAAQKGKDLLVKIADGVGFTTVPPRLRRIPTETSWRHSMPNIHRGEIEARRSAAHGAASCSPSGRSPNWKPLKPLSAPRIWWRWRSASAADVCARAI